MQKIKRYIAAAMTLLLALPLNLLMTVSIANAAVTSATIGGASSSDLEAAATDVSYTVSLVVNTDHPTSQTGVIDITFPSQYTGKITSGSYNIFDAICGNTSCNDSDMTASDPTGSSAGEVRVDDGDGGIDYIPVTNVTGSSVARKIRVFLPPSEVLAGKTVSFVLTHGINNPSTSGSICSFLITTNVDGSVVPGCLNLTATSDTHAGVGYHYQIDEPSNGTVDSSIPVTVKLYDGYGNLVTTGPYKDTDVGLLADGDAEGGTVDISNGVGTINVTDHTAENVDLSLQDISETGFTHSSTQNVTFAHGAATKFEFDGSSSGTVDNSINVTVRLTDQYGNTINNDSSTRVELLADSGSSSLGEGSTLTMSNGEASLDITDHVPETVPLHLSDIDETGYNVSATDSITFNTGSANKFVILAPTSPDTVGDTVQVTIQLQDQYGNVLTNDNSSTVTLNADGDGSNISNGGAATMTAGTATLNLTDHTAETVNLSLTGSELITTSTQQVVFNHGPIDHFDESLSQETIQAGQTDHLTITAKDQYGNTVTDYTGDHNFYVSGLQDAPDGTHHPTLTDKDGDPVVLTGDPSATVLTFTNGVNTAGGDLVMYKSLNGLSDFGHAYEGEITGSFPFLAQNAAADHYTLTSDDVNSVDDSAVVDVMLYDQYDNPAFTGDYSNAPITLSTDHSANFDGDTQQSLQLENGVGETHLSDKRAETATVSISGFPDGAPDSSNSPINVIFAHGLPAGYVIVSDETPSITSVTTTAGTGTQFNVGYADQYGNLISDFTGTKTIDFSGLTDSPNATHPTISDKNSTDQTLSNHLAIDFENGESTDGGLTKAYDVGTQELVATDHDNSAITSDKTFDLFSSRSGNMEVKVAPSTATSLSFDNVSPNPVQYQQFNLTLRALDAYGNTVDGSNDGATYSGTADLSTSATAESYTLPSTQEFTGEDAGVRTFPATFNNLADNPITVTATDGDHEISGQTQFTLDTLSPVDPTGSPVPGVYTSTQQVTLTADGATTIHYNIGTAPIAPTCSTGAVYTPGESDPISVTASNPVIKAIACYSGDQTSEVATLTYTIINVQQPTSNPVSGSTFITSANIVLSHNSSATSIHYVMNNSTPTCSNIETLYTNPIVLLATATIKAVSCYPGNHTSDVATFTFTQNSQNNNENNGGGGVVSVGGGGGGPSGPNTPTPTQTTGNTTSGNGGGQHVGDCTSGITNSVGQDEPFSDEIGHWSHDCVLQLYKAGVVTGRAPHLYVPEGNLTRAEAVKIGLLAFGYKLDTTSPSGFTDLDPNAWYVPYLRKAKQQGFISGTQFHPNDAITRADALVLFLRIAKKLDTTSPAAPFTDVSQSASYAQYVNYAYAKNIVKGRTPTTFVPNGTITRAEIAKIVALIEAL